MGRDRVRVIFASLMNRSTSNSRIYSQQNMRVKVIYIIEERHKIKDGLFGFFSIRHDLVDEISVNISGEHDLYCRKVIDKILAFYIQILESVFDPFYVVLILR